MKIAIIPARGGSKRIPKKNIRNFCGKPIINWSIEAALKSKLFDHIILSTDCNETITIAQNYNALVTFLRPKKLSDDHTTTTEVINHAINEFENLYHKVEIVCCIYATAPFISPYYLKEGFKKLKIANTKYSFAATEYSFPIQRALKKNHRGQIEMLDSKYLNIRSQDLEKTFHDAGQFYWGWRDSFLNNLPIFYKNSQIIILPKNLAIDIDTEEDWKFAELMFKASQLEKNL